MLISSKLTDTSPMPFGKYRGVPMQDVPVDYLHHVWHNFTGEHVKPVIDYIRASLDALKMENEDLIWKYDN